MPLHCWTGPRSGDSTVGCLSKAFIFFLIFQEISSCALPTNYKPSWSIESSHKDLSQAHSRHRRAITTPILEERMDCSPSSIPPVNRANTEDLVSSLMELMNREGVDAYIITSGDEHQSEYVADYDLRRDFITGFTGSAGTAVIVKDGQRALWTDGRYYLQADMQLDCKWILMKEEIASVPTITEWLKEVLPSNSLVGADPKLISFKEWLSFDQQLQESGIKMKVVQANLVDEIWPEDQRSKLVTDPVEVLELRFAGKSWQDKVTEVREEMKKLGVDLYVVTAMDEVAWLFNLRGNDIPYNPVFRSYAIIDQEKIRLFIDPNRQSTQVDLHLVLSPCAPNCVELVNYQSTLNTLRGLSSMQEIGKVLLPSKYAYSGGASYAIYNSVPEKKRFAEVSPILRIKARKNPTEVQGMKNAHIKDSVALIDFLSFLQEEMNANRQWDEMSASKKLTEFRSEQADFKEPSFETISAYGSNGAVIHYRPTEATKKKIGKDSLYLLDSGGQYKDGTTDVTRTMHYGTPGAFEKEAYTRVLMGAIDLATTVFPEGTKDTRIDLAARSPLYKAGLNYNHGTGHGIGMYLNIHESPIQMRIYGKEEHTLEEGHFFSDEPGYYQNGDFGIRLETIMTIVKKQTKYTPEVPMLGFEAVALVPFEPKLIDYSLLNREQCEFLNAYNSEIRAKVGRELKIQGRNRAFSWMEQRTKPLTCNQSGKPLESGRLKAKERPMPNHIAPKPQEVWDNKDGSSSLHIGLFLSTISLLFLHLTR